MDGHFGRCQRVDRQGDVEAGGASAERGDRNGDAKENYLPNLLGGTGSRCGRKGPGYAAERRRIGGPSCTGVTRAAIGLSKGAREGRIDRGEAVEVDARSGEVRRAADADRARSGELGCVASDERRSGARQVCGDTR